MSVHGPSRTCKLPENIFRDAAAGPPNEAIIDSCGRPIHFGAIAPAAATFKDMYDTADDAAIIYSFDTPDIARKIRMYTSPLLIAEPKQISAHDLRPRKRITCGMESSSVGSSKTVNEF